MADGRLTIKMLQQMLKNVSPVAEAWRGVQMCTYDVNTNAYK